MALLVTGIWPSHSLVASDGGGGVGVGVGGGGGGGGGGGRGMPAPAGYTARQMIFDCTSSRAPASTPPSGTPAPWLNPGDRLERPRPPRHAVLGAERPHHQRAGDVRPVSGQREQRLTDGTAQIYQPVRRHLPVDQRRGHDRRKVHLADDRFVRAGEDQGARHDAGHVAGPLVSAQPDRDTVQRDRFRPGRLHRKGEAP